MKESVSHLLLDEQLKVDDIGLIISSQSPKGLAVQIAQLYGEDGVVVMAGESELYSAGIAFALESAMKSRQFSNAKRTLFVSVVLIKPGVDLFAVTFALFRIGAIPVMIDPGMGRRRMTEALSGVQVDAFAGIPKAHLLRYLSFGAFKSVNI